MRGRCDTLARDSPGPQAKQIAKSLSLRKIGRDPFSPLTRRNGPHPYANTHRPSHTHPPTVSVAAQLRDSAVSCSSHPSHGRFIPFCPFRSLRALTTSSARPMAANRSSSNPNLTRSACATSCSSSKSPWRTLTASSSTSSRTGREALEECEKCERKAQRCRREAEEQDLKWHEWRQTAAECFRQVSLKLSSEALNVHWHTAPFVAIESQQALQLQCWLLEGRRWVSVRLTIGGGALVYTRQTRSVLTRRTSRVQVALNLEWIDEARADGDVIVTSGCCGVEPRWRGRASSGRRAVSSAAATSSSSAARRSSAWTFGRASFIRPRAAAASPCDLAVPPPSRYADAAADAHGGGDGRRADRGRQGCRRPPPLQVLRALVWRLWRSTAPGRWPLERGGECGDGQGDGAGWTAAIVTRASWTRPGQCCRRTRCRRPSCRRRRLTIASASVAAAGVLPFTGRDGTGRHLAGRRHSIRGGRIVRERAANPCPVARRDWRGPRRARRRASRRASDAAADAAAVDEAAAANAAAG